MNLALGTGHRKRRGKTKKQRHARISKPHVGFDGKVSNMSHALPHSIYIVETAMRVRLILEDVSLLSDSSPFMHHLEICT
jgi:hypothetical protein